MSHIPRNLLIGIPAQELESAIKNEEIAGFILRGISMTADELHNNLFVEEGEPPVELASLKVIDGSTAEEAGKNVASFHAGLPADGGVVAWGRVKLDVGIRYVAAYRNRGMSIEVAARVGVGLREAIVARAVQEWEWFGRQEVDIEGQRIRTGKQEDSNEGSERVALYWAEGARKPGLTGKDRDQFWSAAFISYVMVKGGAGALFQESEAHQVYIHAAMVAARDKQTDYGYWGAQLAERAPEVGDLICAWRDAPITFERAQSPEWYASHCDLVVGKTEGTVTVIGGNVSQSVTKRTFHLKNGRVTPATVPQTFAILENRMPATVSPATPEPAGPVAAAEAVNFQTCSHGWEVTGYFTPVEGDYTGNAEEISIAGMGKVSFADKFLKATRMEGWGKTRFGWYLGYYSDAYHRADFAKDRFGNPLRIGSVAVDQHEIPFQRRLTIPDLSGDWGETVYTAVDVGGRINAKHIDVYCGEGVAAQKLTAKVTINKPTAARPNLAKVCFT